MPDDSTPEELFSVSQKVVVVTGASRGIGENLAKAFSERGADVYGFSRWRKSEPWSDQGFTPVRCDITNHSDFGEQVSDIFEKQTQIDVLINCAGVSLTSMQGNQEAEDNFLTTINTNLVAAYNCSRVVLPYMSSSGGGSIINITSIGSLLGFPGNPGYVASKGGLRLLTKALAIDFGRDNVRVNNLVPGYIHTNMTDKSFRDPRLFAERVDRTILGRWGSTDDLVGAAIFLGSGASCYVTGTDLVVDGGWSAKGL